MQVRLFDESIDRSNTEPGRYSEPDFDYLNRSGRPAAQAIRVLLEDWFSRYPEDAKAQLAASFRSRENVTHEGAFFELYVHELLLKQGYSVSVHPQLPSEKKQRPDFLAKKGGRGLFIEAVVASNSSKEEAKAEARLKQVYDALNKIDSPNFFVGVEVYGVPSTPIRQNDLRRAVEAFLSKLEPDSVSDQVATGGLRVIPRERFSHDGCVIEFFPIPKSAEARGKTGLRPLGMVGPGEAEFVDDAKALKNAVTRKAKRYGEFGKPFLVAVNAKSQYLDEIDINDALFGQESYRVTQDINGASVAKATREMNGAWIGRKGPTNTRVSAVLIVSSLAPWSVHVRTPIVWYNPWAKYPCTDALLSLSARVPVNNRMEIVKGKDPVELFTLPADLVSAFRRA